MAANEKALIRQDPSAAASNRALLSALASRSGYSPAEVRDVVTCYRDLRARVNALADWRDGGRPLPDISDREAKADIIERVQREKKQGARARGGEGEGRGGAALAAPRWRGGASRMGAPRARAAAGPRETHINPLPPPPPPAPPPAAAEMDTLLARRDRANCPVRAHARVLGKRTECPNTRLPYMHCCGAKPGGARAARAGA